MPTSIPYDPSLELANIVPEDTLVLLLEIAKTQASITAAEQSLNDALMTSRSLQMTLSEMINMKIDITDLADSVTQAKEGVKTAAKDVVNQKLKAMPLLKDKKGKLVGLSKSWESPVDYTKTVIKQMPLSADSLTMDAQYFSHDSMKQGAENSITAISTFVTAAVSFLGDKATAEATAAAKKAVTSQIENHDIEGTLIITCSCTHKQAVVLAPCVLDVDKAIRVWNKMFGKDAMIKPTSREAMAKIAANQDTEKEKSFNIISGASYGSSFIGMVHVLRDSSTNTSQTMQSTAASMRATMEVGSWFESMDGGVGVNASFANDVKQLLSSQDISSHISLICVGCIPKITSNQVANSVKQFASFDPAAMMTQLAAMQTSTNASQSTVSSEAQNARDRKTMTAIKGEEVKSVMTGLADVDDGKNGMLDINSLMTAFEDYAKQAAEGKCGVPVTYYLQPITASELAQLWVAKYFPNQYVGEKEPTSGGIASSTPAAAPEPAPAATT